jgi:hypothetical protein
VPFGTARRIRFLAPVAAAGALASVVTGPAKPIDASHVRDGVIVYDHSGRYGFDRIFAMTATGANPHPLTTTRLHDGCPCSYSPNGSGLSS